MLQGLFNVACEMWHLINLIESPGPFLEHYKYQKNVK